MYISVPFSRPLISIRQPFKKKDKSRNLFKFVWVLLSESVERFFVSNMWDFCIVFTWNKDQGHTIKYLPLERPLKALCLLLDKEPPTGGAAPDSDLKVPPALRGPAGGPGGRAEGGWRTSQRDGQGEAPRLQGGQEGLLAATLAVVLTHPLSGKIGSWKLTVHWKTKRTIV